MRFPEIPFQELFSETQLILDRVRIEHLDWSVPEVGWVVREQFRDSIGLHRCDQSNIMGAESGDAMRFDQRLPNGSQLLALPTINLE